MNIDKQIKNRIATFGKTCAVATLFTLPISTTGTLILFLFTTLIIILSGHWKEKITIIRTNPVALYFLFFYLLYVVGATYSIASATTIKLQLIKFGWLLLTPLWITLFTEKRWQQRAINAFLTAMVITLILSFVKHFQWINNPHFWHLFNRRLGTNTATVFKDYIIQSFLMTLAAMMFLHRFIQKKQGLCAALFLLATIQLLFINQGRTGYIIFIALLIYMTFSKLPIKKALVFCSSGAILLTGLLILLPGATHQRIKHAINDIQQWHQGYKRTSLGYRMAWQENSLTLIKQRPFIGYGTGSIQAAYVTLPPQKTAQTGIVNNTSNEYLNIAIQFGGIGLLLFLGMLFVQWRYSFYLPQENRILAQTLLIAIGIGNLANSWLMDVTQGYYYALITAIAFGAYSTRQEPSTALSRSCSDEASQDASADIPA